MLKNFIYSFILILITSSCAKKKPVSQDNNADNSKVANALIKETSPYLLQHAYNPVDWKPWGNKALELAKKENKLIIVSVGYSACHWCHVMEEESFENDSIAKLMNDNFISIKVDREERPDVDQIYMNAVQLMTGGGGWPLNCITLPDGRPVFGGTYFTKKQWAKVLVEVSDLYKNEPDKVISYAEELTRGVKNSNLITLNKSKTSFSKKTLKSKIEDWKSNLDYKFGGQNNSPKFPNSSNLNFLLRYSFQNVDNDIEGYVNTTLNKMADGGIYDHIGGGFSRYSVDKKWHIPHFEKMLYDNAQLVSLYSKAFQKKNDSYYKKVVKETLGFVERELLDANGSFLSSIDADSKTNKGIVEEGAFYRWTKEELKIILKGDFDLFSKYYNINSTGHWEDDYYVLYKTKTDSKFSELNKITEEELNNKILTWKKKLFNTRSKRNHPKIDDKVLTSWNALMLEGYVDAYRVFGNKNYLKIAINNANFIKNNQIDVDGKLFHSYRDGISSINGFSEDYAHLVSAYISLYQVTLDEQWLNTAKTLADYCINHFFDEKINMFYFTSNEETSLITRKIETIDNVIPSSNSVLAKNYFKLGHYFSNEKYLEISKQMLNNMTQSIGDYPSSYSNWLDLYLNYSSPYYEVAISGSQALDRVKDLNRYYKPNILIAGATNESKVPIMKYRYIEDGTYIYVCVDGTCKLPVKSIERALEQISK